MRLGRDGAVRFTPTAMAASARAARRARDHLDKHTVESEFKPIEELQQLKLSGKITR